MADILCVIYTIGLVVTTYEFLKTENLNQFAPWYVQTALVICWPIFWIIAVYLTINEVNG